MKLAVEGIFFDHMQKTGGTAIYEWLADLLGKDNVSPMFGSRPFRDVMQEYSDRLLVSGHCYYLPGDSLDPSRLNFTLLRDPVDRVLSEYSFCRFDVPDAPGQSGVFIRAAKSLQLDEFIEVEAEEVASRVRNAQTMHYGTLGGFVDKQSGQEPLGFARLALHAFDFVGTIDRLSDFTRVLAALFGRPEQASRLRRVKASTRPISRKEMNPGTLQRLRDLNRQDCELFETARTLEDVRLREWQEMAKEFQSPLRIVRHTRRAAVQPGVADPSPGLGTREIEIVGVAVEGDISHGPTVSSGEIIRISVTFKAKVAEDDLTLGIRITDGLGRLVHGTNTRLLGAIVRVRAGEEATIAFRCRFDVGQGEYFIGAALHRGNAYGEGTFHAVERCAQMSVTGTVGPHFEGYVRLSMSCEMPGLRVKLIPLAATITIDTPCLANPVARVQVVSAPSSVKSNEVFTIDAMVTNAGDEAWPVEGIRPVVAAYKLRDPASRKTIVEEGTRTLLPRAVRPGEQIRLPVVVRAPDSLGSFTAEVWLLQEYCQWFCASEELQIRIEDDATGSP